MKLMRYFLAIQIALFSISWLASINSLYAIPAGLTQFWVSQWRSQESDNPPFVGGICLFAVDGKWIFEIGGSRKMFDQIKDLKYSYIVVDEVETGYGNKIPLWLFGFTYWGINMNAPRWSIATGGCGMPLPLRTPKNSGCVAEIKRDCVSFIARNTIPEKLINCRFRLFDYYQGWESKP